MAGSRQDLGGSRHEQPMRHQRHDAPGSGLARRPCRAQERAAGADQVVDDEGRAAGHIAHEQVAGDDAGTAVLVRERLADRAAARGFQRLAQELGALGSAGIRGDDAEVLDPRASWRSRRTAACAVSVTVRQRKAFSNAAGLCTSSVTMASVPTAFEQAGNVSGRHRIVGLGAAVLARIAQIGHDGRDPRRAGILERADEEQEPAQLVIGAHGRPAVQALDRHRRPGP